MMRSSSEPDAAAGQPGEAITNGSGEMFLDFVNAAAISLRRSEFFSGISQQWFLIDNNLRQVQIFERKAESIGSTDGCFLFDSWG
jgi:hypothetical protein